MIYLYFSLVIFFSRVGDNKFWDKGAHTRFGIRIPSFTRKKHIAELYMNHLKIVSLLPSTTELACSLGLEQNLIAVSHECDYPTSVTNQEQITSSIIPQNLTQLEIDQFVTNAIREQRSLYSVDAKRLIDLDPDIVLTQGLCDVCAVTPETIQASLRGVECTLSSTCTVLSMNGTSLSGICSDLRRLADQTNCRAKAESLIADATERWERVQQNRKKKRVLLLEWVEPFFSAGHWVPEQAEAAGCTSVIGSLNEDSRRLTLQEVLNSDPDYIAVVCCGFDLNKNIDFAQKLYQHPDVQNTSAVQNQRIWAFDANSYFSRPTLRIVRGAELLMQAIHNDISFEGESQRVEPII